MSDDAPRGKLKIESEGGGGSRLRSAFWTVLIIGVILLIAGGFISRTESFQNMVVDYYSDRLGMDVTVGSARIDLPYTLVVEDLRALPVDGGVAGLTVGRLESPLYRFWDLGSSVEGVELRLQEIDGGDWLPSRFRALGRLQSEAQVTDFTRRYVLARWLEGESCSVLWYDRDGENVRRSVQGLTFTMRADSVAGHDVVYYRFRGSESVPGQYEGRSLDREWIATQHNPYVSLLDEAGESETPDAGGDA